MKKTQAVRNGLGRAQWPGLRAAWVVRDGLSSSLSLFFFFLFSSFSGLFSNMFWAFL